MHTLERKATSSNERDENQVDRPLFAVAGIRLIFIEIGASFEQDRISTRVGRSTCPCKFMWKETCLEAKHIIEST